MCRKKIALYVEGQTEHVLLNHLILSWWNYSNINIQNLKLRAHGNVHCNVPSFPLKDVANPNFLIIDVEGVGSLSSIIAGRADKQHELGYNIIGLRDLYAEDYEILLTKQMNNPAQKIRENFKLA